MEKTPLKRKFQSKKETITVEVAGGLGNQLFCYFAGFYFAQKLNSKLRVDLLYAAKSHSRQFDLTSFKLKGEFVNDLSEPIKEMKKFGWKISDSLAHRSKLFNEFRNNSLNIFTEKPRSEFEPYLYHNLKRKHRVKGFFTTSRYLEMLQEEGMFQSLELINPSRWFLEMQEKFLQNKPISVHIRRGDFVAEKSTHGVLSEEYFRQAIEVATSKFQDSPLYVFTNDIEGVREWEIFKRYPVEFIERESTNSDDDSDDPAEHLKLMSLSRVNIVANSSFSLFAALLNSTAELIIRPEPVAKAPEYRLNNFYPKDWHVMSAVWE